jgi:hypothetical protein
MVFISYAMPYYLADEGQPFHFINGALYPIRGAFDSPTPSNPVWTIHIGI